MRNPEEALDLITKLVENKGGEFALWFDADKSFVARMMFEDGSGYYTGTSYLCGEAVNDMLNKVLEGERRD